MLIALLTLFDVWLLCSYGADNSKTLFDVWLLWSYGADNSKIKVLVLILFFSYIYSMNQSQIFPSIMWHNWRQRCTFCVHCMFICKIDVVRVFEYVIKQEDCAFQNIEENRFRFSNQFIPKKIVLFHLVL